MNCPSCSYELWNLPGRTCPECGTPFVPSQFKFVINSVRFCCPHCAQEYYGTGQDGHLEPRAFDCVRCRQHIDMDQMVLLPADGVPEAQTKADAVPWIDPDSIPFFGRFFRTIGMCLSRPGRLAGALASPDRIAPALGFASGVLTLYSFLGAAAILIFPLIMVGAMARGGGLGIGLGALAVVLVGVPIAWALLVVIYALCAHSILRITGPVACGLPRTIVGMAYASAAGIMLGIPCIGFYFIPFFWVWWSINAAIMLSISQKVSGLRAAVATVTPPLVTLVLVGIASYFLIFVPIKNSIATASTAMAAMAPARTKALVTAITASSTQPRHAIELITTRQVTASDFFRFFPTTAGSQSVGNTNIMYLATLPAAQQTAAVNAAIAALPKNVVAHRVGDMVFTYHGINTAPGTAADPNLWIVICAPSATSTTPPNPFSAPAGPSIEVGLLDGSTQTILIANLPGALAAQNALRAAAGLLPLPDPTTIADDSAVAGSTEESEPETGDSDR